MALLVKASESTPSKPTTLKLLDPIDPIIQLAEGLLPGYLTQIQNSAPKEYTKALEECSSVFF